MTSMMEDTAAVADADAATLSESMVDANPAAATVPPPLR